MSTGKNKSYTSGYRYYFSVLAGICRGPVDEVFLIKSDGRVMWDGTSKSPLYPTDIDYHDPYKPFGLVELGLAGYTGGTIKDNISIALSQPDLYGGEKSEGGVDGLLSVYFGAKDQVIAGGDYVRYIMEQMGGLMLSSMRGVLTAFFDGMVCANNPYPKAWTYRVRRALKGWDGDVWYPERAVIKLTDPSLPIYSRGAADTGTITVTTIIRNAAGVEVQTGAGASSGSATFTTYSSTYTGATVNSYSSTGGTSTSYAVPLEYNDIYAMNGAHIIYECASNRDWGRGLDRNLIDNVSFTEAANTLADEGFGLCMKWSRTEDVDVFVQTVLDHIGGSLYTDKLTGLLCLRLIRGGYNVSNLAHFDYNSGLLEVNSSDTPANDVVANEVIVKYRSPVLDADKEARAQNIASMNSLGCVYSTTRDYSGLPNSTLALRVAQRDLKIFSGGWKKVEVKLDRRAYAVNPGDVIVINAPDRKLNNVIVRVATIQESAVGDGSMTLTGAQDIFGLPITPMIDVQQSEFLEPNRYPVPIRVQNASEATYRDVVKFGGWDSPDLAVGSNVTHLVYLAAKPTASSLHYRLVTQVEHYGETTYSDWAEVGTSTFARMSTLTRAIGTMDTVIAVSGELLPGRVTIGSALTISHPYETANSQEFVRLDGISRDAATGQVYLTVARGCVDTPALTHPAGSRVWAYDDTGIVDPTEYTKYDGLAIKAFNHTTLGDSPTAITVYQPLLWRIHSPYSGADFRANGYPRDATPPLTGTLTFTWKHRDRTKIEDHLVGEIEEGGQLEPKVDYQLYIQGTSSTGSGQHWHITNSPGIGLGFQGNSIVVTEAELAASNIGTGPMYAFLVTGHRDVNGYQDYYAYRWPRMNFYYGVEPDTTAVGDGFNFDFNTAFDGVPA